MRKIELYQCGVCNTQYADERACRECEKNHKTKLKIFGAQHVAYKNNRKGWPVRIFVQDTDGSTAEYKLQ